jgi:hypothetical protein
VPATKLIIGEGLGDHAFFRALLAKRGIGGYAVHQPANVLHGGSGYFEETLKAIQVGPQFAELKLLVVAADNDEKPGDSFKAICKQIKGASGFGRPSNPREIAHPAKASKASPLPSIVVVMLPGDSRRGALETLCYESAQERWPKEAACAEAFAKCVGADRWEVSKRDKLKLNCLLGAICPKNPTVVLSKAWSSDRCPADMIPLDHKCFDGLVKDLGEWGRHF